MAAKILSPQPPSPLAPHPLPQDISFFLDWGGSNWRRLFVQGMGRLGWDWRGKRVLEIGCRYGRLSCLFALLGAEVTGVDSRAAALDKARQQALELGVAERTLFVATDNTLSPFYGGEYDLVVTKSVLVVVNDLTQMLRDIHACLAVGGHLFSLENGKGSTLIHAMRRLRHRQWHWKEANWFRDQDISLFRSLFSEVYYRKTLLPPVFLIQARR